ncbi:hypothetical protein Tel_15410 [Candidatus Tenderia electrophaga]|jgi:voltage-gated sodium channel|uniref:Ion transport domain-containing protein n=1 Tax=Candidatus Tenderia electrophaga TaxID=1748243 RepID=A0A0S2TH08_9GAMM|nr:hypothetical protein Tel_15410 [Candidatus Tenderia electrophaga]
MNTPTHWPSWRLKLKTFIDDQRFQRFIITLILINAAVLGLLTDADIVAAWGELLHGLDAVILAVFVVEITLRLLVHRLAFFRDPWSVFDFLVVAIALVPATGPFEVLRALRVLRVLRLLTMVPSMRKVVAGMLRAIPGLGSVGAIMCIIFYVAAVMATNLFGERFPEWFGSLGASAYTLFQIMTLESWSMGIVRPVMEVYPHAWLFFLPFILIATFTVLNLLMAVIVNAVQEVQHSELEQTSQHITAKVDADTEFLQGELRAMRDEIKEIKGLLSTSKTPRG